MKIIDCFMYYDEDMILDVRLNTLNKYVSNFIICEANFNHNGTKRELQFNINNFKNFKEKIIYIPLEKQPQDLRKINKSDSQHLKNSKILDNALLRENFQRNYLLTKINDFEENDLIIISDVDEIPNLSNFEYKNKITFFEQKMFYYKLNLVQPNFIWYGSKICKKKYLKSPQWLRNIKSRKYPRWRIDALFSNTKYYNIDFVKNGGWHFTNVKTPEKIDFKMKNFLHHLEYEESGLNIEDVAKIVKEEKVFYNHSADKKEKKWNNSTKLIRIDENLLPDYVVKNKSKFIEWLSNS